MEIKAVQALEKIGRARATLGRHSSTLRWKRAPQKPARSKVSEPFHLFVNGGQQLRQNHRQFVT